MPSISSLYIHSTIVVPARWKRINNEPCTINVFTNREVLVPLARILIPKYTLPSWENGLAMMTEKVHLCTGAVYRTDIISRLYTLDGYCLHCPTEMENSQYYVAVGADKFRALPCEQRVPLQENHPGDQDQGVNGVCPARATGSVSAPLNGTSGLEQPLKSQTDSSAECDIESPQHTVFPLEASGDAELGVRTDEVETFKFAHTGFGEGFERTARGQTKNHTDSAKPGRAKQQRQVSRIPLLFPSGEGSVFNAKHKRREMAGAAEVQEDCQLKVDLPIDQVEAKVVEEECEHGCSRSCRPCKASLLASDGSSLQSLDMKISYREKSEKGALSSPTAPWMENLSHLTLRYDLPVDKSYLLEPKEEEVSSKLGRIRSRIFWFFKGRFIKA
ncbi:doublecortin domain-containing protein 2 [Lampris incognitus]|uniref:doublecortin domain-containing protein 2 n=1 Tax=Lampris incognitus TaxID=2546036 RepID=UPI0024B5A9B7|nr:doublecortin domain-containing protein 2 [Lampris incognitus]